MCEPLYLYDLSNCISKPLMCLLVHRRPIPLKKIWKYALNPLRVLPTFMRHHRTTPGTAPPPGPPHGEQQQAQTPAPGILEDDQCMAQPRAPSRVHDFPICTARRCSPACRCVGRPPECMQGAGRYGVREAGAACMDGSGTLRLLPRPAAALFIQVP